MRLKRRSRFAERSSFESCSASVSSRRSPRNCSRSGPSTAASRERSRIAAKLARICARFVMSSSVELIETAGESSSTSVSTTVPASLMPCRRSLRGRPRRARPRARRSGRRRPTSPCRRRRGPFERGADFWISPWASSSASRIVSSGTWSPPASTIVSASLVPTTMRSSVDSASCSRVGLRTNSSSTRPTRTAPIGPRKGSGEISAADAR